MSIAKSLLKLLLGADRARDVEEQITERQRTYAESREREDKALEEAEWIGKTGLPEDLERELPRYLRREFGELMEDEGALKAADLIYKGAFPEGARSVHFWQIPSSDKELTYAYIAISPNGDSETGWGNRKPPNE